MNDGLKLLADYVFLSKYAQKKQDGTLETWEDAVDRIYSMHEIFLISKGYKRELWEEPLQKAKRFEKEKYFLSSQRARQFAEKSFEKGILKHHAKIYNCSSTLIDRPRVFTEIMYLLLCGCGVGYSIRKIHTTKLPQIADVVERTSTIYSIEDSIEGWAEAINVLMMGAFTSGKIPLFDYSQIRPKGTLIAGRFKAPGPDKLRKSINAILNIVMNAEGRHLTPYECHRILCFIAKAVVSGGVRRSAMIALFDKDDQEMIHCKIGNSNWYKEGHNPELAMANNSIAINFGDPLPYEEFSKMWEWVCKGDPGLFRTEDDEHTCNPLMQAA